MRARTNIPANLRYSLIVVGLLLLINTFLRLAFLLYNSTKVGVVPAQEIAMGFLRGIRFDLATIFIFNGLILLFMALPLRCNLRPRTYKILNVLIIAVNIPVLLVNFIDMVYFGFAEKRLTHELFTTRSDFGSFKPSMLIEWWWVFLLFITIVYLFYKVLNHFTHRQLAQVDAATHRATALDWGITFIFVLLMYAGMRGGIQRPINMDHAFVGCEDTFTGNLALNSAFCVLSTIDIGEAKPVALVPKVEAVKVSQEMVRNSFDGPFTHPEYPFLRKATFSGEENRYNVVLLIIESLNAAQVGCLGGSDLTPNLDSLTRHGRMYRQYYANGIRSVEALPSLLNSMPEIFRRPTIWSHYTENHHHGIGNMLQERGYHTSFFCGSRNGTMGFDKYSQLCGIDHYYGMNEYPYAQRDFNGYWGCHDGPFVDWMAEQQNAFQEPFLSVFFSISNHHPFHLPAEVAPDIAALPLSPMDKTVMYTDRVLGEYFRKVRNYPWFERTIFLVTGDHCFHEQPDPKRTIMDNFRVPLLMIGPCIEPGFDDRIGNHVSVMPTLIELLRLDTWHASTAVSLFEEQNRSFAINSLMGVTTLAMDSIAFSSNFESDLPAHVLREGKWMKSKANGGLPPVEKAEMEYRLRCIYQTLQHARIENRLHAPDPDTLDFVQLE